MEEQLAEQSTVNVSNSFNDNFEQILQHEVSPNIWLSVFRLKILIAALYVDIRQKQESKSNGKTTLYSTKNGVFLRRHEFDDIKEIYNSWKQGLLEPNVPHEINSDNRKVLFGKDGDKFEITLQNRAKVSKMVLSSDQMRLLADYPLTENLASLIAEMNWESI